MKLKNIEMSKEYWLELFHEYYFVFFSTLGVVALRLKKYMKWYVFISKVLLAFFLGMILYYSAESLNLHSSIKGGSIAVVGYAVDEIYTILITTIKSIPKILISVLKGRLNIKEDCKIDEKDEP